MFQIGQKVVCIDDTRWTKEGGMTFTPPAKNEIYAVSGLGPWSSKNEDIYLSLEEFKQGFAFLASYFRPLVSTSTKQSRQAVIDKLLADAPKQLVPVDGGWTRIEV